MKKIFILALVLTLCGMAFGARYTKKSLQIVDEWGDTVTNIDIITIYDAGTDTESTIYTDGTGNTELTNPMTTTEFSQSQGYASWYSAGATYKVTVTESGASQSLTLDNVPATRTRFAWFVNYIGEAATLQVTDDTTLDFGTSDNFYFDWSVLLTKLILAPSTDHARWDIGIADVHTDIYWHTGTAITDDYVLFDEGSANVFFKDVDLVLDSSAILYFGDSSDVSVNYDESNNDLDILNATSLDEIAWGATGDGYDQVWHSTTAGDYMLFDYDKDALLLEDMTLAIGDAELLLFGDAVGTGTMSLSVATAKLSLLQVVADTGSFDIGAAGTDVPTTWHGETSGAEVTFTGDTLLIDGIDTTIHDDDLLKFGDAFDVTITWNQTNLLIESLSEDTGEIEIGATNAIDLVMHANTAASEVAFNANTATAEFNGYDIQMMADDIIAFGDSDEGTLQYDEDGEDAMQWNNVPIYGSKRLVEMVTASDDILAAESGKVFVDISTEVSPTLTLPSAAVGLTFTFIDLSRAVSTSFEIKPASGDKIAGGSDAQIYASLIAGIGSIQIVASDSTYWNVISRGQLVASWALQ